MQSFGRLREDAASAFDGKTPEAARDFGLRAVKAYVHQMELASVKLPVGPGAVPMKFKWTEAYDPSDKSEGEHWAWERCSMAWNYAALQTELAAKERLDTEESCTSASRAYMAAAGAFEAIKSRLRLETWTPKWGPKYLDFKLECLDLHINAMLGSAQLCILLKAQVKGMSSSVLARVALASYDYFCAAFDLLKAPVLKRHSKAYTKKGLDRKLAALARYSLAIAHHESSKVCLAQATAEPTKNKKQFAVETGHLRVAKTSIKRAIALLSEIKVTAAQMGPLEAAISQREEASTKENDFIYMQTIPEEAALPVGLRAKMAKVTPYEEAMEGEPDLFESLLPPAVTAMVAVYNEEMAALVSTKRMEADAASQEGKVQIASLGLPHALTDTGEAESGLPDDVWAVISGVQAKGGAAHLNGLLEAAKSVTIAVKSEFDDFYAILEREKKEDGRRRVKHGANWDLPTMDVSASEEIARAKEANELLVKSVTADARVATEMSTMLPTLEGMMQSREAIAALVPSATPMVGAPDTAAVERATLQTTLVHLGDLIGDRAGLLTEIEESTKAPGLAQKLVAAPEAGRPAVVAAQKAAVNIKVEALVASVRRQEELLKKVCEENAAFVAARTASPAQLERESALSKIRAAATNFNELCSTVENSTVERRKLLERVIHLCKSLKDTAHARQTMDTELDSRGGSGGGAESKMTDSDAAMAAMLQAQFDAERGGAGGGGGGGATAVVPPGAGSAPMAAPMAAPAAAAPAATAPAASAPAATAPPAYAAVGAPPAYAAAPPGYTAVPPPGSVPAGAAPAAAPAGTAPPAYGAPPGYVAAAPAAYAAPAGSAPMYAPAGHAPVQYIQPGAPGGYYVAAQPGFAAPAQVLLDKDGRPMVVGADGIARPMAR